MTSLKTVALGDLIEFQRGFDLPKSKFKEGDIPVISSNGVLGYHNECKVKGPGITIGRSGTVGLPHYIEGDFFPHNTALFIKDFKENHPRYIYYLLKYLKLNDKKSGSGVPTMNRNHLHPLKVKAYTNVVVQKQVANVLHSLDSKIELNNRINQELEGMAKLLYDYWFVQFDFPISEEQAQAMGKPDLKGKPYKSSGGPMVYNKQLKREIPEGWESGVLGDIIALEYGKALKSDRRTGEGYPVVGSSGIVGFHSEYLVNGPGIVVGRKGTIGKINYLEDNFYPIDTTYYVKPKIGIRFFYLYFLLNRLNLSTMNSDSAVPGLNRDRALSSLIEKIPERHIQTFEEVVAPMFLKIRNNNRENRELTELRDWLLPMLMNGQVKVGDYDLERNLSVAAESEVEYQNETSR